MHTGPNLIIYDMLNWLQRRQKTGGTLLYDNEVSDNWAGKESRETTVFHDKVFWCSSKSRVTLRPAGYDDKTRNAAEGQHKHSKKGGSCFSLQSCA